jgi:short coiled-coil protein
LHTFAWISSGGRASKLTSHDSRHAQALQDSLLSIFHRIEAVKEEHDKLDNNNKFLQKYIGDLMSTSKITATGGSRSKK